MIDEIIGEVKPGLVVLFGSGETSPHGRKVFEWVLRRLPANPRMALLETPAGFEVNSARVIGRVAEFLQVRLQNFMPEISVVPARRRGTALSPDELSVVSPLLDADVIFMGPGSPTYAVRQLKDSLAWQIIVARHLMGGSVVLASAAAIAVSRFALPVYEIFKVGEDLHWKDGLDLFGLYELPLVFIPHWNNHDGGDELDTSRCFMGKDRFEELMLQLPLGVTVLGIDESTALIMDLRKMEARVIGQGGVTLIHAGQPHRNEISPSDDGLERLVEKIDSHYHVYRNGEVFPLEECCPIKVPPPGGGVPERVWGLIKDHNAKLRSMKEETVPAEVMALIERRQAARQNKDWDEADKIRKQIEGLGWQIQDTPEGPKVLPCS